MANVDSAYVSLTGDPETDALLFGTVWKVGAGGTATITLTYSFATAQSLWPGYGSNSEPTTGFAPLGSIEQQAVRSALLTNKVRSCLPRSEPFVGRARP